MSKSPRSPFDVRLSDDARKKLAIWLADQVQDGLTARATEEREVSYWWTLYEQGRTRTGAPWKDAADLTSYIPTEKTDALHARLMRTVFGAEPVWTVEGWGEAANRAPIVEEFHQWKVEEERLQSVIDRLALQALVEPRGLIEVSEGTDIRTVRKQITAKLTIHPETGGPVLSEDGTLLKERDRRGNFVEAKEGEPAEDTIVDSPELVRTGPVYRILPYSDSLILPAHARDQDEIRAYAKRFWRRMDQLEAKADAGLYDEDTVERMHGVSDREGNDRLDASGVVVTPTNHGQSEKELWEGIILVDLEELYESLGIEGRVDKALKGERWYLFTLHMPTLGLLRLQFDDMERSRFVPVILFPRVDRVTEGYSLIGHKLITVTEEHTAWRNMAADRGAMKNASPVKRQLGALWDPQTDPWRPGAVIDVRDMREIEAMDVPDVAQSVFEHISMTERIAERIAGINDVASGQVASQNRTLGEVQMATEQSFVRMDLVVKRFQEALEELAQIRHAIWKRTLAERGEDGIEAPASMVSNLEGRGESIDSALPGNRVTAAMLDGVFRFKPHGSVENADPNRQRNDLIGMLQALPMMLGAFPALRMAFSSPQAARAMGREFLKAFKVRNQQAILGSVSFDLQQQTTLDGLPMAPAIPMPQGPPMPGGPMGGPMPPMGGPAGPPALPPPPPMPGGPQGGFPPIA